MTGFSGAGKSAVSRRLTSLGYHAASTDSVEGLCRWIDDAGQPVERPDQPSLGWLATHHWVWDPARLDQLITSAREHGVQTLFLCGDAANALELAARFEVMVLLRIDLVTMLARLETREPQCVHRGCPSRWSPSSAGGVRLSRNRCRV